MKKILNLMLMSLLVVSAGLVLSACGKKATLQSISIQANSVELEYVVGQEPDFSDMVVVARFSNGDLKNINLSEVTISEVNTGLAGDQTVTVTYKGLTATITISYYLSADDVNYNITGFEQPQFVTYYKGNIAVKNDKQTEFVNRADGYYVGDDNAFKFLPIIRAITDEGGILTVNRYKSINKVEMKVEGSWVELTDNLATYVSIDDENSLYDFTEAAIGKEFKLTVLPAYYEGEFDAITFDFKVIDGWNAYNAKDLSRLDNASNLNGVNPWAAYKQANGVGNEAIKGLILHSDIRITKNDLPADFFWTQSEVNAQALPNSVVGSLKDWTSLYVLSTAKGTTFNFIGNYFQIDAREVPLVKYGHSADDFITETKGLAIHATLFGMAGDDHNSPDIFIGEVNVKNMNLVGNANRSEDTLLSGGLTFFRTSSENFTLENTISRQVLTIMCPFGEWVEGQIVNDVLIKDSKGYDSFSIMFYMWGAKVHFVNSEFKNAGGPIMILTHYSNQNNSNQYFSSVTSTNTVFESNVTGDEAWFKLNGANGIAIQISAILAKLDQKAADLTSTYRLVNSSKFNFVSVIMGEDLTSGQYPINGSAAYNVGANGNVLGADLMNPVYQGILGTPLQAAPILETSSGNYAYAMPTQDGYVFNHLNHTPITSSFFGGDYLNLYYNGMALTLAFTAK